MQSLTDQSSGIQSFINERLNECPFKNPNNYRVVITGCIMQQFNLSWEAASIEVNKFLKETKNERRV